jgi:hypothetical protein
MHHRLFNASQAASCLLCFALAWRYESPIEGTEFTGGSVTGPIFHMFETGTLLLLVAASMAFWGRRRISSGVTLLAASLCLPLYLYFVIPGPFRWLFSGPYKLALQADVVWDTRSIVGIVALAITAGFGVEGLFAPVRDKRGA